MGQAITTITEVLSAALFILAGCVPLIFAIRAKRRWVRVTLGLLATVSLLLIAVLILFAGVGAGYEDNYPMLVMSVLSALGSLVALVTAFVPTRANQAM